MIKNWIAFNEANQIKEEDICKDESYVILV